MLSAPGNAGRYRACRFSFFTLCLCSSPLTFGDQALWAYGLTLDSLEHVPETNLSSLTVEFTATNSVHSLLFTLEGDKTGSTTDSVEIQALYGRALSNNWDMQLGWRNDLQPHPQRQWLVAGLIGTPVWDLEAEVSAYAGRTGRTALTLALAREFRLTANLSLVPEVELNVYGKRDAALGTGEGLGDSEIALRFYYAVTRQFAPYLGVVRERLHGDTATLARSARESTGNTYMLLGITAWF